MQVAAGGLYGWDVVSKLGYVAVGLKGASVEEVDELVGSSVSIDLVAHAAAKEAEVPKANVVDAKGVVDEVTVEPEVALGTTTLGSVA